MLNIESHTAIDDVQADVISGFGTSYGIPFDRNRRTYIPNFNYGNYI